ncbi:MAG: TonB family protein, partial [Acidobacteria bacterium]|nr:TonB family protein [Acidobacteriota bacterium]
AGGATLTGRETYKYDDKGNISEMTLFNADGSLLSKEVYTYEYDFVGNWTKMTTSVAVIEGGKLSFEPTEVTYRTISYYLDENVAKMVQPPAQNAVAQNTAAPASSPAANPVQTNAAKPAIENASVPAQANAQKSTAAVPPASNSSALNKSASNSNPVSSSAPPAGNSNAGVVMEAEPPAKSAPKPLLRPISGGVLNGKAVQLPSPEYPEIARRGRIVGLVTVEVIIDVNGKVISAKPTGGPAMLQQAAAQAAMRARFSPTTLSGQPVKVSGVINYNFSLGN